MYYEWGAAPRRSVCATLHRNVHVVHPNLSGLCVYLDLLCLQTYLWLKRSIYVFLLDDCSPV